MAFCPKCGAQLQDGSAFCGSCGANVGGGRQNNQYGYQQNNQYGYHQYNQYRAYDGRESRSKVVAGILGILLGGIGIHYFYLNKIGAGILSILFCWTGIPAIVGLVVGIMLLCMNRQEFEAKYGFRCSDD